MLQRTAQIIVCVCYADADEREAKEAKKRKKQKKKEKKQKRKEEKQKEERNKQKASETKASVSEAERAALPSPVAADGSSAAPAILHAAAFGTLSEAAAVTTEAAQATAASPAVQHSVSRPVSKVAESEAAACGTAGRRLTAQFNKGSCLSKDTTHQVQHTSASCNPERVRLYFC